MKNNNRLEKETIKTLNSENQINQNSIYRTYQDDNSSKNCPLSTLLNEIYKNNNPENNKLLSEVNKYDNFHCSGKFNIIQTSSNNIPNGGNENYDNNDDNSLDNNNNKDSNNNVNGGNYLNKSKNEFGFTSFKSFFDNNNKDNNMDNNKDNNTNNSTSQKIEEINDKYNGNKNAKENFESNGYNGVQNKDIKPKTNIDSMGKENNNNNQSSSLTERNVNYSERYNNFSQYSDSINNNDNYLNYESNYSNSNKREEIKDIRSLYHEESEDY
jgi:hypothetical protein